jgi:hypothetical protein
MANGTIRPSQLVDFQIVAICLIAAAGLAYDPLPYLCVVIPALLPLYLWLTADAPGLPTLPLTGALSIIYYAVPVFRGQLPDQDPGELLYATVTVGCFLVSATIVYALFLRLARRRQRSSDPTGIAEPLTVELAFMGLAVGIAFYAASFAGWLDWLGSFAGVARAVMLTFGSIGCYLVGDARARNLLQGDAWAAALFCLAAISMLSINGLLLVGGAVNLLAAILGYVVGARRIPWITLAVVFAIISIFQAGKFNIRAERADEGAAVSLTALPGTIAEWFADGIEVLWSGTSQIDALERASLLWVVIRVEEATPDFVPYLDGETYALLPQIVLPRFVEQDKMKSQAGLNLLAVHYGFQVDDATDRTTIGFGLVAESYANFGFVGVLAAGAAFGLLCGAITWFGAGASAISLRMLISIAATSVLLNLEADFSYLIVTMAQAIAGVVIAAAVAPMIKMLLPARSGPAQLATARRGATFTGRNDR